MFTESKYGKGVSDQLKTPLARQTVWIVSSRKSGSGGLPSKRNKTLPEDRPPAESIVHTTPHHSLPTTDCSPSLLELSVQLSGLHHANKHEHESTPGAKDLDGPPAGLGWEDWKFLPCAVTVIPEIVPIHVAWSLSVIRPRREGSTNASSIRHHLSNW